ncbi:MAG: phosphoserine phosphatase SerB [Acidobacteria bacterium]|nr:phosphoserine phosphatase SerB [Acidobacteriota bacterium]
MREIFLLNVTGQDRPGLTARLTAILGGFGVEILDIGQAVIHNHLSLGMLVEIPPSQSSSPVLKEVLYAAHGLGIAVSFEPVAVEDYERWVADQGRERHTIIVLGRRIHADQLAKVAETVAEHGLNIDSISRLSERASLDAPDSARRACIEFSVSGPVADELSLRRRVLEISEQTGIDVSVQVDDLYRRSRRLVVFDMDSTLIQAEVIDELAKEAGAGEKVAAITAAAMRGELDFKASLRQRVATLEGLDEAVLERVAARLPLTEGVERLTSTLKRLGYKIGILSGGFDYFGHKLQARLGFDYVYANRLEIVDGKLTGRVLGEIIDGDRKAALLREIALAENISLHQTIAVGDGANDLPMLGVAGLGVAFHPKPIVARKAKRAISNFGLDGLLYLIGIRDRDIRQDADPV